MGFVRNTASVFATTAVSIPLALATNVLLARQLSVSDRGVYALAATFSLIAYVLTQLGWGEAAIYRMRRHGVAPRRILGTGLAVNIALCAVLLAACALLAGPITRTLLGGMPLGLFQIAMWTAALLVFGDFLRAVARGLDRFDLHNWFGFLQSAGMLALLAIVLLWGSGGVRGALWAGLLVQALLVALFLGVIARATGVEPRVDLPETRAHLRFALAMYPQALLNYLHERIDVFILAWLGIASGQIALYAVAVSVIVPLQLIPGAVGTALLPELAAQRDGSAAGFAASVARQISMQMAAIALALAPAGMIGIPLLFGDDYRDAVPAFLLLLPGMAALASSRVLGRYFAIVGQQRVVTVARACALLLNVGLNLALVPRLGITGAALAALLSYLFESVAVAFGFVHISGSSFIGAFAWRRSDLEPYLARARALRARARH